MPKEFSTAQKERFLSKAYFGISDNPLDDVNPYHDLDTFLSSTVGSLRWGGSRPVRKRSKERFSHTLHRVLAQMGVELGQWDALEELENDSKGNAEVVTAWAARARFPVSHK